MKGFWKANQSYLLVCVFILFLTGMACNASPSGGPSEVGPQPSPQWTSSPVPAVTPPTPDVTSPPLTITLTASPAASTPQAVATIESGAPVAEGGDAQGSPSNDALKADLIFASPDPIVALAAGANDNLFVRTSKGEILHITPGGVSEQIYSGLTQCAFSRSVMATLPNGDLVLNDCRDNQDTIIQINLAGNVTTLLQLGFDQSIVSMVTSATGNLYLGTWLSEGNISLNFNPTHLGEADHIFGRVSLLSPDNQLSTLYEGGIPLDLAMAGDGRLSASIWGQSGPFQPTPGDYSVCAITSLFWVGMSDRVEIKQFSADMVEQVVTDQLRAVSSIAIDPGGRIFTFGMGEAGTCGIHHVSAGQPPSELVFLESGIDLYTTDLIISGLDLYFATGDGNVYQVKDFTSDYAFASDFIPSPTQAQTATPQEMISIEIIDPSDDVSAAHIDVVKLSYVIAGETLRAVFHLRDVPTELTFNRAGVPANRAEYMWIAYVDVDNNPDTGEQNLPDERGSEYAISVIYYVSESASESTTPIEDTVQVNVWKFDPTDGSWSVVSAAIIEVDPELDTITVTGEIPGLTSEARIFFLTHDYTVGEDT